MRAKAKKIWCPGGDLVGLRHTFSPDEAKVIEWDVLGDPRTTVRVCADCAEFAIDNDEEHNGECPNE